MATNCVRNVPETARRIGRDEVFVRASRCCLRSSVDRECGGQPHARRHQSRQRSARPSEPDWHELARSRRASRSTFESTASNLRFARSTAASATRQADWWKAGLVHDATMASDGVCVEGADAGLRADDSRPRARQTLARHVPQFDLGRRDLPRSISSSTARRPSPRCSPARESRTTPTPRVPTSNSRRRTGKDVVVEIRPHAAATAMTRRPAA